jgi:UDP-N-acetylglucosamine--N-acetylmuramyl-(pentapeptide) pyrophosphoryl-undecaprenol N-acetylglucosamine transferase
MLPRSFLSARRLIRELRADAVVGAGGYVSGPVLLTASVMGVPTLVMESNALPGWTNRVLARFVDRAAVTFPQAMPFFKGKAVVTGNPVRSEFFEISPRVRNGQEFALLIFGGSQGARAINQAMVAALPALGDVRGMLRIVHQAGEADLETVKAGYAASGWENVEVRAYLDDMVARFAAADLVVCRAGATTSAELVAAGKAAIMVPFPFAADDHQRKNAEALEQAGAARTILQQDLTGDSLAAEIKRLMREPQKITEMEQASRKLARADAAAAVVDLIQDLIKRAN